LTQHEYIFVAVSIILGLALTRVLHSVSLLVRAHARVSFHWASALWGLMVMAYILQLWWVGWRLRDLPDWGFSDFLTLVVGSIFVYGAAEMALPDPSESDLNMLSHNQRLGRLSAVSMLVYFLIGPYVNYAMFGVDLLPALVFPALGVILMGLVIAIPDRFVVWSLLFGCYTILILYLTI
jgi:hypothetical protein